MSLIEPTLELSYWEGSDPLEYHLTVKLEEAEGSLISHLEIPSEPQEGSTFQIIVVTGEEGSEELSVDLGEMFENHLDGEVEIILHDASSEVIGKNKIRAQEAQKEERPIGENW